MKSYISLVDEQMKNYLNERIGYTFYSFTASDDMIKKHTTASDMMRKLSKIPKRILKLAFSLFESESGRIGRFRQSGEIHQYLHDIYSLTHLLSATGFSSISKVDPYVSEIPGWNSYELDVVNGRVDGPLALYVEAKKTLEV